MIGNPKVLILDEPTVGLDPKQMIEIRNLIRGLGKTHTVILSSHILSEVQAVCDRVVVINKGKVIADDTAENLFRTFEWKKTSNKSRGTTENGRGSGLRLILGVKQYIQLFVRNQDAVLLNYSQMSIRIFADRLLHISRQAHGCFWNLQKQRCRLKIYSSN